MLYRKIYNKFTVGVSCSLMMMIATTAIADRPVFQYSRLAEQGNPWSLPPASNNASDFQQMPKIWRQQHQGEQIEKYNQGFRFVTPEILESLKQQQTQTQLVPESKKHPLMPRQPIQNSGYPSSGRRFTNPLYDTPAVSPWSSGPDIFYGGESFPFVAKEEIDEYSLIHIPPFDGNNGADEPWNTNIQKESNVFNPFNFGHYGNL